MATSKPFVSPSLTYETLEEMLDVKPKEEKLFIGIPREDSFNENRIALSPEAVGVIVANGHDVVMETKAGDGANFSDKNYSDAGAKIVYDKKEVFNADVIVKSAPVSEEECELLKQNQYIISPIHVSVMKKSIIEKMMAKKITALSFENLKDGSGHNPIVRSMSEIAGSAVILIAGQYLSNANNGKGVLLGGISGIPPTKVIIIGAGIVGEYAARTALAMGASVKVFDNSIYRLKRMQNNIGVRLWTSVIEPKILAKQLKTCDVAVGALSADGGQTPMVVSEEMVSDMRPGSVIVDVSIDHGGCFETSMVTTHKKPVFRKYDVIHYCVPNIPSGFARTASQAISNVLMSLLLETAEAGGVDNLIWHQLNIRSGIYMFKGALTNFYLSEKFDIKFTDLNLLIASRR
ncbi:MAG: alanine dehydrogenase [Chitinophagaceae bacterium]|jgi:alanine dehydrogenase|nr:alanine dehydrogenase [Chitinophagaceae bacterium]MBP6046605.1 alanine dehydrogenase [Ferruginibacter sp.]NMD28381.1 alanine dehydrogenase [Bacteroidota bacterium]MBK7345735.1 alanine dehydrogenase [Chitinophagaceae bacterium]MBK8774261.1 alanine dehydrogenase [Chitinophagaceae bacterium]